MTSEFYDRFMIGRRSGMTHGAAKKVLVGWRDGWFRSPLAAQMERGDWGTPRKEEDMKFMGLNEGSVQQIIERLDRIADRIELPALQMELDSVSDAFERKVFGRAAFEARRESVLLGRYRRPARARLTWRTAREQESSGRCAETAMMIADEVMKTLSVPTAKYTRGDRVRFNHAGQELTGEVYAEAVADLNRNTLYPVRYGTWLFYVPEKDIVGRTSDLASKGAVPSAVVANTAAVPERAPSRAEAPCPRPGCGKPNDVGVKVCWGCGGDLP